MIIDSFTGQYRFLSNFYPSLILYKDRVYPTVEHGYQADKNLNEIYKQKVRDAATPGEAKSLGRTVLLRADWDSIKIPLMYTLVKIKFNLPGLKESLLSTNNIELIEGNYWGDTFWGVCNGIGKNELGKILMRIRKELQNDRS